MATTSSGSSRSYSTKLAFTISMTPMPHSCGLWSSTPISMFKCVAEPKLFNFGSGFTFPPFSASLRLRLRLWQYIDTIGCPLISLWGETKRNGSENERSEIAREKKVSFACFALKRNGIFCMWNEMIWSEKYEKMGLFLNRISAPNL